MVNPAIEHLPRSMRRHLVSAERQARASGKWGAWERQEFPHGIKRGTGWTSEVRTAVKNAVFCVLVRPLPSGEVHLAIASLSGDRPTWWEAQRIKNELAGEGATAVEVYPPQSEVVDEADMYHLWTVPKLPFSIFSTTAPEGR